MVLTSKKINSWKPLPPNQKKTVPVSEGSGLSAVRKGSSVRFVGKTRFPKGRKGKSVDVPLGIWQKDIFDPKQALTTWIEIKKWSDENELHPKKFFEKDIVKKSEKTLKDAFDEFIEIKKLSTKPRTYKDRINKTNQMLQFFGDDISITDFEIDNGGMGLITEFIKSMNARGSEYQAHRCRRLLNQVFDICIRNSWMKPNQNPATKKFLGYELITHKPKGNAYLSWKEVPSFLTSINENKCDGSVLTQLALKLHLLMITRVGALVRLRWEWFDKDKNCWIIPSSTSGLKNVLGNEDDDHIIPSTPEIEIVINQLRQINGRYDYVFYSPHGKIQSHMNEETINNCIQKLGYKGRQTAHGWRDVVSTSGQEEIVFTSKWKSNVPLRDVISRQVGHKEHKKGVMGHYDNTEFLPERRDFMKIWNAELVNQGLKL